MAKAWGKEGHGSARTEPRGTVRRHPPWVVGVPLLGVLAGGWAYAGGGYWRGSSVGIVIGVPLAWPYYRWGYDWPYYQVPPAVSGAPGPTAYIERGSTASSDATGEGWWHYCRKPEGYYPYVKKCPGGWEKVAPNPYE